MVATKEDEQTPALRAGIVIIGSEVLTAKVADENGPFLLGRLRALGVSVGRMHSRRSQWASTAPKCACEAAPSKFSKATGGRTVLSC